MMTVGDFQRVVETSQLYVQHCNVKGIVALVPKDSNDFVIVQFLGETGKFISTLNSKFDVGRVPSGTRSSSVELWIDVTADPIIISICLSVLNTKTHFLCDNCEKKSEERCS